MAEQFRSDPQYAVDLLNEVLKNGDVGELMVTLRQLSMAEGGIGKVAKRAQINRTQAYRTLSRNGRPELQTVKSVLAAMNLQLYVRSTSELETLA